MKYRGADWLVDNLKYSKPKPRTPSDLGKAVADILGAAWFGIYHLPWNALQKAEWENDEYISVVLPHHELATYDGSELTMLVVCCHDSHVRLAVRSRSKGYLELLFHKRVRSGSEGADVWNRHPTLENAALAIRKNVADLRPAEERPAPAVAA